MDKNQIFVKVETAIHHYKKIHRILNKIEMGIGVKDIHVTPIGEVTHEILCSYIDLISENVGDHNGLLAPYIVNANCGALFVMHVYAIDDEIIINNQDDLIDAIHSMPKCCCKFDFVRKETVDNSESV